MYNDSTKKPRNDKEKSHKSTPQTLRDELIQNEKELTQEVEQHGYKTIDAFVKATPNHELEQDELSQFIELQKKCGEYLKRKEQLDNTVIIEPAKLSETVAAAERILINNSQKHNIYQRSGKLVRVTRVAALPNKQKSTIKRPSEAYVIREIDQVYLTLFLNKSAHFVQFNAHTKQYRSVACKEGIARYLLSQQEWDLPVLTGIINTPTLRSDGSILDNPGYDSQSGLLFISDNCNFEKIPTQPTKDDAIEASEKLLSILKDFPFENNISRSVALAAILTALVRRSIASAPLFGFSAPTPSSGKTLLADTVSLIATGKRNSPIAQAENETEGKKRLLGLLMEGDSIICYDNVDRPFGGAAICVILTEQEYKDRKLGVSETRTVPTHATFLATGNNLAFIGDTSTRTLLCKLDPQVEHPEERKFDVNLHTFIPQHRSTLVKAALTMLRAYYVAGRPPQNIPQFGRFEEWSDWIRSAIVWLDMDDPCESRKEIEDADPIRSLLESLFYCWYKFFGNKAIKANEIVTAINNRTDSNTKDNAILEQMRETILELTGNRKGEVDARKLAGKLRAFKKRIVMGYRLEQMEKSQGTTLWAVKKIET